MLDIFRMFGEMIYQFSMVLHNVILDVGGVQISYLDILIGFICLSMIVTIFWKGAER